MKRILQSIIVMMLTAFASNAQEMKEIFAKKELDLDSSFINNTIRYRPKIPPTASNKRMAKVSFGSFEIARAIKDKGQITSSRKRNEIFSKYYQSTSSRKGSLTIVVAEKDTVLVDLLFELTGITTTQTYVGRKIFGQENDKFESSAECAGMVIDLPGDTILWNFIPVYKRPTPDDTIHNEFGKLVSATDSIEIKYLTGFKGFKKLSVGYPTGIIFNYGNKPIAAHQLGYKKYVWLSANQSDKHRSLIGACILAILCVGGEETRY